MNNMPEVRRNKLKQMIENKEYIRVMEASNGLTGLIVENTKVNGKEYDAMLFDYIEKELGTVSKKDKNKKVKKESKVLNEKR